jgi:hypothetical protein
MGSGSLDAQRVAVGGLGTAMIRLYGSEAVSMLGILAFVG